MSHDIRTPMNAIVGMTAIATAHIDDQKQGAKVKPQCLQFGGGVVYKAAMKCGGIICQGLKHDHSTPILD